MELEPEPVELEPEERGAGTEPVEPELAEVEPEPLDVLDVLVVLRTRAGPGPARRP